MDQMRPKLHHMGRLLIYLRVPWCLRPHSLYLQNSGIWKLSNIYGLKQHGIYPKPSHMVDNWGLSYWTASIFFYKNIFFRGYMASNIMDSQNISKMLPYWEVLVIIGQLGPEILAASIFKNFLTSGCVASNIMESQNISKTFLYGEVLVSIGLLGPELLDSLHNQ